MGDPDAPEIGAEQQSTGPGERLPGETTKAYAAFRAYLEAGPARTVAEVARELNKSGSLLRRWSSRYRWQSRAESWDSTMRRTFDAELLDARRSSARQHLRVAAQALAKIEARVSTLDPSSLSPADLTRLWDTAARIERDVIGEPRRVQLSGPNGGPVRLDVSDLDDEARRDRLAALRREIDQRLDEATRASQPLSPTTEENP